MSKKEKKTEKKYDEKVKIDIPNDWGFDDTLKAVISDDNPTQLRVATFGSPRNPLKVGEFEIPCFVLDDEPRVVSQRGLYKFLGIRRGGASGFSDVGGGGARLARFLKNLHVNDLDINALKVALESPIVFTYGKVEYHGYEARKLPEIVRSIS